MKNILVKKELVIGIMILFVGASFIPCIGGEDTKKYELIVTDEPPVQPLFTGNTYFIMLSNYSDTGQGNKWAVQLRFDDENKIVESENDYKTLPLITDRWVEIKISIDLDSDWMEMYYGGKLLHEKNWTAGYNNQYDGLLNIAAVDLYANSASSVFYDDISLEKVGDSVIWSDNFDSYENGSSMHGQGGWKGWYNDPQYTAYVTSVKNRSSPHSVDIANNSDLVHEYSGCTSGEYVYIAWMYIPEQVPPYEPSNPKPDNGATNVSIYTNLSWTGGDPNDDDVTYNVFFEEGDPTPDILVSENQTNTSYDPGTLEFGTQYYWQIVAYDEFNLSKTGQIWNFTTLINDAPYTPSDPSPKDGSTEIEIIADLSWTGGDPNGDKVTYDIYFGTDSPPPKIVSNQSKTSYDPGLLEFGTTYYWQIVAWDIYDYSSAGSLWSFTTEENEPPYTPSDPNPPDGATDVSIEKVLIWSGGDPNTGDTVTYDVYFGDSSPPPLVAEDLTQYAYDPGTMDLETTYYWQIISEDSQGETATGPIWSFTTKEGPNEAPTAPDINGPSSGKPGEKLCWTFNSDDENGHKVKYFVDWGDSQSDETALNEPSTPVEACHTYEEKGEYTITAYAQDEKGLVGEENTFELTIPRAKGAYNQFLFRVFARFPNLLLILRYVLRLL